ncbi:MAG: phosphopantetheine-binding protein [Magnetospirillum sp. WYHS-4]
MTEAEIRAQVLMVLKEVAPDLDEGVLKPDVNFRDQFEFDSVDCLNFALALERTFTIHIPELDYPRLSSLDSATAYLTGLLAR